MTKCTDLCAYVLSLLRFGNLINPCGHKKAQDVDQMYSPRNFSHGPFQTIPTPPPRQFRQSQPPPPRQ